MADEKPQSLADKLKAQKAAEEKVTSAEPQSLADKLKAQKAAEAEEKEADKQPASMADKLKAQKEPTKPSAGPAPTQGVGQRDATAEKQTGPRPSAGVGAALSAEAATALRATITDVQQAHRDMLARVKLTELVNSVGQLAAQIKGFPHEIADIRRRGYPFHAYLESKTEVFGNQWDALNQQVQKWIDTEARSLTQDLDEVEALVAKLNPAQANTSQQNLADQVKNALETLDAKVNAAEERIQAVYDALNRETSQTQTRLSEIKGYLELKDNAGFSFLAGEAVYMVARAEWDDGRDKPDGYLFLTDQRLIFEQDEKTGKTLGLFGGKQVKEVLWETPLNTVDKAENEDRGMFGGKDIVHLHLKSGAPYPQITLEIKGGIDSKVWSKAIRQVVSGEVNATSVQGDADLAARLRQAPTDCPTCGAVLPQVVAGQNTIQCQYCSTTIRI